MKKPLFTLNKQFFKAIQPRTCFCGTLNRIFKSFRPFHYYQPGQKLPTGPYRNRGRGVNSIKAIYWGHCNKGRCNKTGLNYYAAFILYKGKFIFGIIRKKTVQDDKDFQTFNIIFFFKQEITNNKEKLYSSLNFFFQIW